MTDKNLTEIVCVVDRSGSMDIVKNDSIGGFNQFLADQKADKSTRCLFTYDQFDDEFETIYDCVPIDDVPPLDNTTFVPRGWTALYDAIGRAINRVGARLAATPEDLRPGTVVFVILTDGANNSSKEFTKAQVTDMIARQAKDYNWKFVYIGQGPDAYEEGQVLLHQAQQQVPVAVFLAAAPQTGKGVMRGYSMVSQAVSHSRTGGDYDAAMKGAINAQDSDSKVN